jgi:hypothetical protein
VLGRNGLLRVATVEVNRDRPDGVEVVTDQLEHRRAVVHLQDHPLPGFEPGFPD